MEKGGVSEGKRELEPSLPQTKEIKKKKKKKENLSITFLLQLQLEEN